MAKKTMTIRKFNEIITNELNRGNIPEDCEIEGIGTIKIDGDVKQINIVMKDPSVMGVKYRLVAINDVYDEEANNDNIK